MDNVIVGKKDEIIMKLMHYFVTYENYSPVIVNGVRDEIWLENTDAYYKIIRINANYIHNIEQLDFDTYKVKKIAKQIKRKTLSFNMRVINILLDLNEDVKVTNTKNITSICINNAKDIKTNRDLISIFPDIKKRSLNDDNGIDLLINATKDINEKTAKKNIEYENVFRPKKPVITYTLLGINIFIFILTYALFYFSKGNINLYELFAVDTAKIVSGEYYRLITGTFLHAGPIYFPTHLIFNMYALYVIGSQIENYIGKYKYLIIYFASALMGSLLSSVILHGSSIGASGAVFGLMGSLAYFGYHYRVYFGNVIKTQLIPIILINLLLGFYLNGVDNVAHIGGLLGGVLSTMAVGVKNKSTIQEMINGTIVYIVLILFLGYMLLFR